MKDLNNCFIASAGLGTRMGNIGKLIPKPLWPVFDKQIIDLQISYVKELGIDNIYINSHHLHDQMKSYLDGKNVTLVHEPELLGSGGCIHNIKKEYKLEGNLLIINADQFFFFSDSFLKDCLFKMKEESALAHLFAIKVDPRHGYNETVITNGCLQSIQKPQAAESYCTYSGVGIINLSMLNYFVGESSFFNTVCNFKENKVLMSTPHEYEYWDFGTLDRYIESMGKVAKSQNSMNKFLVRNNTSIFEGNVIQMLQGDFQLDLDGKQISYKGAIDHL